VRRIERDGDDWRAEVDAGGPALIVLKETFHPSWSAEVDGKPVPTLQVTPGFLAAAVRGGQHSVAFRYRPSRLKTVLFLFALATPLLWLAAPRAWRRPSGRPSDGDLPGDAAARKPAR
jgi:uncharacterized membrane protein YfhO